MENVQLEEIDMMLNTLVADRDQHHTALRYAQSTISELQTQNRELELLLSNAQADLQRYSQVQKVKKPTPTSWIGGTWLSCAAATPILIPVESAWEQGHTQKALTALSMIMLQENITHRQRVDAELLLCAIVRSSGDVRQALAHAEKSLEIAREKQLYDLVGKAQFHRGLSFLYGSEYANARWCFVLASHTPGYEEIVAINREMAEQSLLELPLDDFRRALSLRLL